MYWQLLFAKETATRSSPHSGNERQCSVNDLWLCKYGNYTVLWSLLGIIDGLAPFIGKKTATRSSPHSENERQRSINDLWLCKYGNYTVLWSLLGIIDVLAVFIGKRDSNTVIAPF